MKDYIFLIIILLLRVPQNFSSKKTSGLVTNSQSYFLYGTYSYTLAGLIAFVMLLFDGMSGFSLPAVGISALGAVSLAVSLFCSIEALKSGVMVLAAMASSAGLLLPCIAGIFMFNEPMKPMQFIGIALLIFSGWLLIGYSKEQTGSFTPRTLLLLIGSMLSNGSVMLAQKMFSKYLPDTSVSIFSFLTFGLIGIGMFIGLVPSLLSQSGRAKIAAVPKPVFLYGTISSIILLAINQLATLAGRNVPSAIMFPINDGGATIITAITAAIFFKEKLTVRSVCGLILGIGSLIVINLFG
ncbi:putative integral membrane protein [Ruminococcus sp. CAG:488]|nr:putative integral membrane protein [Ruminococcus sp. CAG:488]